MLLQKISDLSLTRLIDRSRLCEGGAESSIQLYAASVLILIGVASALAFRTLDLWTLARIALVCSTLIGVYSLIFRISRDAGISVLIAVGLLIGAPLLPGSRYLLCVMGILGWVFLIRPGLRIGRADLLPLPIMLASIFGANIHLSFSYQHAISAGLINVDTFFHAAIAAMYGNYGVTSLGLDGLVPVSYHTLSHKILAGVANIGGVEALAAYAYIYFAMGPLLLLFSIAGFACQVNRNLKFVHALLGASFAVLTVIAIPSFARAALWDSFFVSESYLISLVLFIASLSALIRWMQNESKESSQLVVSLALLVLAGLSKGSAGLLGLCVFGAFGITRFRSVKYWTLLTIATVTLYFGIFDAASGVRQSDLIYPFDFIRTYSEPPFKITAGLGRLFFFLGMHFLPVWICFSSGLRRDGREYFETTEFQVIFALLAPAMALSGLIGMAGGAAYYFSSVPSMIALCFLTPVIASRVGGIKPGEMVLITAFACFAMDAKIYEKTAIKKLPEPLAEFRTLPSMIAQLEKIRETTPKDTAIKVENIDALVSVVGCSAHWLLPAVMERPIIHGLPADPKRCKQDGIPAGYYGLADYEGSAKATTSGNFPVVEMRLNPEPSGLR
jgi:hypothetical protein